jgi:hypothetical protein
MRIARSLSERGFEVEIAAVATDDLPRESATATSCCAATRRGMPSCPRR